MVVLGSRAGEIGAEVGELGQRTVLNPAFAEGQSTSLVAGITALKADVDSVIILLGDQPLVSTAAINRLAAARRSTPGDIAQAAYGGVPGNPVMFDRTYFPELSLVTGDEGARSVLRRHRADVTSVEVGDVADVIDVDTEEDYAALLQRWTNRV